MIRILKQLFCIHTDWTKGRPLSQGPNHNDYRSVQLGGGRMIPWTCSDCGKTKHFEENSPPIQYLG